MTNSKWLIAKRKYWDTLLAFWRLQILLYLEGYSQNLLLAKKVNSNRRSIFLIQLSWYLTNITIHGVTILTKFHNLRTKTVDFLIIAIFWPSRKFWGYPSTITDQFKKYSKKVKKCIKSFEPWATSDPCSTANQSPWDSFI